MEIERNVREKLKKAVLKEVKEREKRKREKRNINSRCLIVCTHALL